jgi:hypothetical protein
MSLDPAKVNFHIWKGATFRKVLTLFESGEGSPAQDLSGYTANLEIKDKIEGTTLLSLTTVNGGILLGGASGTITLVIDANATALLTWQHGVYDLVITAPSGNADVLLYGNFAVRGI